VLRVGAERGCCGEEHVAHIAVNRGKSGMQGDGNGEFFSFNICTAPITTAIIHISKEEEKVFRMRGISLSVRELFFLKHSVGMTYYVSSFSREIS